MNTVRYGLSAFSPEQFASLPSKLPPVLNAVEFPGEILSSASGIQKLENLKKNGTLLVGRDFITPDLAASIPETNCRLRSELEYHFQEWCEKAASVGVTCFSVAFDLFHAVSSDTYREQLGRFLRRCGGVIHPLKQKMLLVCRIPGGGTFEEWEDILKFRQELLCPGIDFLLELHPHEPNAPEIFEKALKTFRLHDTFRRICYDSSVGNSMTAGALKCCSDTAARDLKLDTVIFLNPGTEKFDSSQLSELENVVQGFRTASSEE